jgi:hypothetical protein
MIGTTRLKSPEKIEAGVYDKNTPYANALRFHKNGISNIG